VSTHGTIYGRTATVHTLLPRQRSAERAPETVLPMPVLRHRRELGGQDIGIGLALLLGALVLVRGVRGAEAVADLLLSSLVVGAIVLAPALIAMVGTFEAVTAAGLRTSPDDRPAPVRSLRRHSLLWALSAGMASGAGALLLARDGALLVGTLVTVSIVAGCELGIALGRADRRSLLLLTIGAVAAWTLVVLLAPWSDPLVTAAAALGAGMVVAALTGRLLCRDTRPGVPVWVRSSSAVGTAAFYAAVTVIAAWVPLAMVSRDPAGSPWAVGYLLSSLALTTAALLRRPSTAALSSAVRSDLRHATGHPLRVAIGIAALLAVVASVSRLTGTQWSLVAGLLTGAVVGGAVICWIYAASRGHRRIGMLLAPASVMLVVGATTAYQTAQGVLPFIAVAALWGGLVLVHGDESKVESPRPVEALPQLSTDPFASRLPLWNSTRRVDVTIVVPFLNPDPDVLIEHLRSIHAGLSAAGHSFELIAVDDGSTSDIARRLESLPWRDLHVVQHSRNRGKGGALATGFMRANGELIGFIDADGDIHAGHLTEYIDAAWEADADIVLADKTHPGSVNGSDAGRRLTSATMHHINRHLLRLAIVDTQTGAKLFRRELVQMALPRMWENGFAFDVEMFVMAQHLGFRRFRSMPVEIQRDGGSTVSTRSTIRTGLRVLAIWRRIVLADYYYGARTWSELPPDPLAGAPSGAERRNAAAPTADLGLAS
jgi:hypothetical protein